MKVNFGSKSMILEGFWSKTARLLGPEWVGRWKFESLDMKYNDKWKNHKKQIFAKKKIHDRKNLKKISKILKRKKIKHFWEKSNLDFPQKY